MRSLLRSLAPVCLLAPALALASPFSEFQIPPHSWHALTASLNSDLSSSRRNFRGGSERGSSAFGFSQARDSWGFDSDAFQQAVVVGVAASGSTQRDHTAQESVSPGFGSIRGRSDRRSRSADERWNLSSETRFYPWSAPAGLLVAATASGAYDQEWSNREEQSNGDFTFGTFSEFTSDSENDWRYEYVAAADAAMGYGRVRDATVVYDVHVLEQRLLEAGTLTHPLSGAGREKLAALFFMRGDFGFARERPERFFWREVERILREDGALGDRGLDAYGLERVLERAVGPRAFFRLTGWFAGPALEWRHDHAISRDARTSEHIVLRDDTLAFVDRSASFTRDADSDDRLLVGARAEAHRPIGMRWQLDVASQLLFPVNRHVPNGIDLRTSAGAAYAIGDRWFAAASLDHVRSVSREPFFGGHTTVSLWQATSGAELGYFLEDHLLLRLTASERQIKGPSFVGFPPTSYTRDDRLSLSLTYRFFGRLRAPGLIEPMRLLRPAPPPVD